MDDWKIEGLSIVNLSMRVVATLGVVIVLGFSFRKGGGVLANAARNAISSFRGAVGLWLFGLLLSLAAFLLSHHYEWVESPEYRLRNRRLSAVGSFVETQAFGLLLVAQLDFAVGMRRVRDGSEPSSGRTVRLWGIVSYVVVSLLNVTNLIIVQVLQGKTYIGSYPVELGRASIIIAFVFDFLLVIVALSAVIYTSMIRSASYASIRTLLSLAASCSVASAVYSLVLSGIYDIGLLVNAESWYPPPEGLYVATVVMRSWMPLIAMVLILVAIDIGKGQGKFVHSTV